jgi:hypothetical protein
MQRDTQITVQMPAMLAKLLVAQLREQAAYAPEKEHQKLRQLITLTERAITNSGVF